MSPHSDLLIDILHYVRSLQKKGVVVRRLSSKDILVEQNEAEKLPGVFLDTEDGAWVRVERQEETPPPEVNDFLADWIEGGLSPYHPPTLLKESRAKNDIIMFENNKPILISHQNLEETPLNIEKTDNAEEEKLRHLAEIDKAKEFFDEYLKGPWESWAKEERPKRMTNTMYKKLFEVMKDLKMDDAAEYQEVVCGIGRVKRLGGKEESIDYPALIRSCEITIDDKKPIIEIRPADSSTVLEVTPFHDVGLNVDMVNVYKQSIAQEDFDLISPFDKDSYENILSGVASRLSSDGRYIEKDGLLDAPAAGKLTIHNHWCFFVRDRPVDRILKDLDALEQVIKSSSHIPDALLNLVDKSTIKNHQGRNVMFRGIEPIKWDGGDGSEKPRDLYFPLAYNDEQVSILQKLDANNGVVVQGPPGTGKSHTIANVICHYLAEGKTVLVTSSSAGPLGVLREKIPKSIRALTAALLSSDRESIKEFEHSIREIATRISGFDQLGSKRKIGALARAIDDAHEKVATIEEELANMSKIHTTTYLVDGAMMSPVEIGRYLFAEKQTFNWLEKENLVTGSSEVERVVEVIKKARAHLLSRLEEDFPDQLPPDFFGICPELSLPEMPKKINIMPTSALPSFETIRSAQVSRDRQKEIHNLLRDGMVFALKKQGKIDDVLLDSYEKDLVDIHAKRAGVIATQEQLSERDQNWDWRAIAKSLSDTDRADPQLERMKSMCVAIINRYNNGRAYDGRIIISPDVTQNEEVVSAIEKLARGEEAFGFFDRFTKKNSLALIDTILFDGKKPSNQTQWDVVSKRIKHLARIKAILWDWNNEERLFFVPKIATKPSEKTSAMHILADLKKHAEAFLNLYEDVFETAPREKSIHQALFDSDDNNAQIYLESIRIHRELEDIQKNLESFKDTIGALDNYEEFGQECKIKIEELLENNSSKENTQEILSNFVSKIQSDEQRQKEQMLSWEQNCAHKEQEYYSLKEKWETDREQKINEHRENKKWSSAIKEGCDLLKKAGASSWALICAKVPCEDPAQDPVIPDDWKNVWKLQCAKQIFFSLGDHKTIRDIMDQRREAGYVLSNAYKEMVEECSWLRIAENSTPQVRSSLQKYLNAVKKIGHGTGKRAMRYQKTARDAMKEAYQAIPCWIMPYQRVSESMPAQLGLFDLVVIDEASQADVQVMPALFRGKKFLIVGDDKQVSPAAVGRGEEELQKQSKKYLARQPFGHIMGPDQSIYDLFSEVFAGNDVMLREHFRSVRSIIEFSNREFYSGKIIPLRLSSNDTALNPPLVNIYVEDGKYSGKGNVAEANVICQQIENIIKNPAMANKTIGVVTLHSDAKQSTLIRKFLDEKINDIDYLRHDISVGPPPAFQGKERDIIFVSMTWDESKRGGPADTPLFEQRFNVALSRARDRMILVRSIKNGHARPGGLLDKVLKHFKNPFPEEVETKKDSNPLHLCDTHLEREIASKLIELNYQVKAHVGVRGFRMDLVVEGEMGRCLAIGCDGDRPNEQEDFWQDEMTRQRVLERAGWVFWRCFASHYEIDPDGTLNDLISNLKKQGINPVGVSEYQPWVDHLSVKGLEGERKTDDEEVDEELEENSERSLFGPNAKDWPTDREFLMSLCDVRSPPEKDLLGVLLDMGYRVQPQYEARGYFIDFIVQGPDGKKLAIEYDGNSKYDDPDYLVRETERQRYLESVEKLIFWRVFHSDFTERRQEMIKEMTRALETVGVKPFPL